MNAAGQFPAEPRGASKPYSRGCCNLVNMSLEINYVYSSEHDFFVNHLVVSNSSWTYGLWPTRHLCPWNFPDKNWSGLPFPSPRDLPHPRIKPGLHCRQILYRLSHQGSPVAVIKTVNAVSGFTVCFMYYTHNSTNSYYFYFIGGKTVRQSDSEKGIDMKALLSS